MEKDTRLPLFPFGNLPMSLSDMQNALSNANKQPTTMPLLFPSLPDMQLQMLAMMQMYAQADPKLLFGPNFFPLAAGLPPTSAWLPPHSLFTSPLALNATLGALPTRTMPAASASPHVSSAPVAPVSSISSTLAPANPPPAITHKDASALTPTSTAPPAPVCGDASPQPLPSSSPSVDPTLPAKPLLQTGRASAFARVPTKRKAATPDVDTSCDKTDVVVPHGASSAASPSASTTSSDDALSVSRVPFTLAATGHGLGAVSQVSAISSPTHASTHEASQHDDISDPTAAATLGPAMAPGLRAVLAAALNDLPDGGEVAVPEPVLYSSVISVGGKEQRQFVCPFAGCNTSYLKSSHLCNHIRRHTGEKRYECTWPGCTWKFCRSDELKRHMRSHDHIKTFHCHVCPRAFSRSDHLNKHVRIHERKNAIARS